jgi:hypothetical protein
LNFFHHGLHYNYPFLAWSLVFFLSKRFPLALFLAGCAWNFHPMCTVFLLFVYGLYWLFNRNEFSFTTIVYCILAFTVPALPILIKALAYTGNTSGAHELWFKGVYWGAWYTTNPLSWPMKWLVRAGLFFAVFLVALLQVPESGKRKTIGVMVFAVGLLCFIGTVFADIYPVAFIIRLSLWRSTFLYLLLALPVIAYFLVQLWRQGAFYKFFVIAAVGIISGYVPGLDFFYMPAIVLFLVLAACEKHITAIVPILQNRLMLLPVAVLLAVVAFQWGRGAAVVPSVLFLLAALLLAFVSGQPAGRPLKKAWLLPALFVLFVDVCLLWSAGGPAVYYQGTIRGEIDPWADVQMAAAKYSHKDDLFIIPPYLNDFGIYSQRATLGDWTEGGNIIYLDAQFAKQWFERMYDLGWRERFGARDGYSALTTDEVRSVAAKYNASFVVTEKPKEFSLPKLYENKKYILYSLD